MESTASSVWLGRGAPQEVWVATFELIAPPERVEAFLFATIFAGESKRLTVVAALVINKLGSLQRSRRGLAERPRPFAHPK